MAKNTYKKFQDFVHVWLPVARYHADGNFTSEEQVERFMAESWAAYKDGKSAHEWGKKWK